MLAKKVLGTIDRFGMVRPGERVLVGLSGGPDSVALTQVLVTLLGRSRIEAAHLNHALREDADADEAFCRELAERLGIAFTSARIDVARLAERSKRSIEEQGRLSRYAFFSDVAERSGLGRIAVGHTRDDQAEAFLMRLARGSGARGLAATYPVSGSRIRPLIELRRDQILDYLRAHELPYRLDPSNLDRRFTRNRIRLDVIPFLSRELNPRLVDTLADSAGILRDEEDFLENEARRAFQGAARCENSAVSLSVAATLALHPALQKRVIRLAVEHVRGDRRNMGRRHVDAVLALLEAGKSGRETHLPGIVATRSFGEISLEHRSGRNPTDERRNGYNGFEYRLKVPGRLPIRECKGFVTAYRAESQSARDEPLSAAGNAVVVGVEDGPLELTVRSPRPSDRFHPLGAPGTKSVARYLMEQKVAKVERGRVPLVAKLRERQDDEILWVIGHSVSEAARLTSGHRGLRLEWMSE